MIVNRPKYGLSALARSGARTLLATSMLVALAGCAKPVRLSLAPDADMLILDANGWVRVAVEDPATGRLVEYPEPIDMRDLRGWTVTRYDWTRTLQR